MKVTELKYTRRFNTGEYEFEEYSVSATVDEDDNTISSIGELKESVSKGHAFDGGDETAEETETEEKPAKKPKKSKPKPVDDEEEQDEESESEDEESSEGEDEESSEEETEESEDDEVKPPKKSKNSKESGKAGKKFKAKPSAYQRTNETHKEIFSGVMKSVAPDWKKSDATKAKAKKVSQAMEGKPFLDENGEVLKEFKLSVKKQMGKK